MEAYANFAVVALVLLVSVVLLLLLLNSNQAAGVNDPKAAFIIQILLIWIIAWGVWGGLWGFKAFSPPAQQFEAKDFNNATQLLVSLKGTNAGFAYLWNQLKPDLNDSIVSNSPSDEQLQTEFARGFNTLVKSKPLFNSTNVHYEALSPSTKTNLGRILSPDGLIEFNRQLVGDLSGGAISIAPPAGKWRNYVWLGLSSLNAVFFLLLIIVVQQQKALPWLLLWTYAAVIAAVIAVYYGLMPFLARVGTPGFDGLLINWSISESVLAPLLLTICIWRMSKIIWPLLVGILYAFAQPIVYQADMNISSLLSPTKSEAILVSLAFLKIFLAASVLYATGRYASAELNDSPFRIHFLLRKKIRYTRWNAAVCGLVIGGILIWYIMAGQSISGLPRALTSLVTGITVAVNLLNLKGGSNNVDNP